MVTSDHVTKMAVTIFVPPYPKNPMLHAKFTALCLLEPELWGFEVLLCGNRNFRLDLFGCRDLDLDPMTFIYELDLYIPCRYTGCVKMNFLCPRCDASEFIF